MRLVGAIHISDAANPMAAKKAFLIVCGGTSEAVPLVFRRDSERLCQATGALGKNLVSNQKPKDDQPTIAQLPGSQVITKSNRLSATTGQSLWAIPLIPA